MEDRMTIEQALGVAIAATRYIAENEKIGGLHIDMMVREDAAEAVEILQNGKTRLVEKCGWLRQCGDRFLAEWDECEELKIVNTKDNVRPADMVSE